MRPESFRPASSHDILALAVLVAIVGSGGPAFGAATDVGATPSSAVSIGLESRLPAFGKHAFDGDVPVKAAGATAVASATVSAGATASESATASDGGTASDGLPVGTFAATSVDTDLFTGAAAAVIPIVVPAGAGGLAPQIMLRYASSGADELKPREQGQSTGLGWTLDIGGYVVRLTNGTLTRSDDVFKLVFNGALHTLVLVDGVQRIYHTKDETFVRVQYTAAGDYWTLTTKDGTRHRFGFNADSKAVAPDSPSTNITYKYLLDDVTTVHGTSIRYAYTKRKATTPTGIPYDQAVYPETITYAHDAQGSLGPLRKVAFLRGARQDWTDTTTRTTGLVLLEKERIETIEVTVGASLVRRYVLGFDYSIDRDPAYTWGGGAQGDLTLRSVKFYGTDGVSTLPMVSFDYANARLSRLNNGFGGSTTFSYERVLTPSLYRACRQAAFDGEGGVSSCADYAPSTTPDPYELSWEMGALRGPADNGWVPLYSACVRPLTDSEVGNIIGCADFAPARVPDAHGFSSQVGYVRSAPDIGFVPLYSACLRPVFDTETGVPTGCADYGPSLNPDAYGFSTLVGYVHATKIDRYRVDQRTVSDGRGGNTTIFYDYIDPRTSGSNFTYEFRGHAAVRAIDGLGHYTDTWFHQDDVLKSRPSRAEHRTSGGSLLVRTVNTWTATTPFSSVTFVGLTRIQVTACGAAGQNCRDTAQTFQFDAYGNPIRANNLGDLAVAGDERDDRTDWIASTTAWIFRPSRNYTVDAAGAIIREQWISYDGLRWGAVGSRGLPTRDESRLAGGLGAANPVRTHVYDAYGNRTVITDARGCATTTVFDTSKTFPTSVTTCLGHTTTFVHDARFGVRTRMTDPNGQVTTYEFDELGRPTKTTGPLDRASTYGSTALFYLDVGNPKLQRLRTHRTAEHGTANVIWSERYFDGSGRTYLQRSQGPDGQVIQTETTYDSRGLVNSRSAPHFTGESAVYTQLTYDPMGRPTRVSQPDGTFATTAYAPGRLTVTNERGTVTRKFLDAHNRLLLVEEVNGGATYSTRYAYDRMGGLTTVTDHLGHVTSMTYDTLGRKTRVSDPNMGDWTYVYDLSGTLTSQTDASNQTLTFTYDVQGRLLTKRYPDGAEVTWTYDDPTVAFSRGRLTQVADLATLTTFGYDALGRTIRTDRVLDGTTYTMSQTYDALGRMTTQTYPDLESVTYTFDEAGWLRSIPGYVSRITYNARGQRTQVLYANGVTSSLTYVPTNSRLSRRLTSGVSGSLQDLTYTHDDVGNVTQIADAVWTGARTYAYDALNRLTSASGTFGVNQAPVTQTYRFDAIGNLLEKAGVLYAYSDPLHASAVTGRSDGKSYMYDANGNMLNGAGRALAWNADNRLDAVSIQGGNSATFAYDAGGIRVRKATATGVTRYPFPGYEIAPDGIVTKFFGESAKKSTGETLFYHPDHLGGVNVITDSTGTRVQLVEYDPWGELARNEGTADLTRRFTGQLLDPETGLMYYNGRYYDAGLARFVSSDPFVPTPGNPQALNRYSYVANNPVNAVDPSGHFIENLIAALLFEDEVFRTLELVVPIVVGIGLGMILSPYTGPIVAGILAGAAAGALSTGLSGGDLATNVLLGAALGGIGGALAPGVNAGFTEVVGRGAAVGAIGGGMSAAIHGGDILQGIALGAVTGAIMSAAFHAGKASTADDAYPAASAHDDEKVMVRPFARRLPASPIGWHKGYAVISGDGLMFYEMGPAEGGKITIWKSFGGYQDLSPNTVAAFENNEVVLGQWSTVSRSALTTAQSAYQAAYIDHAHTYHWYSHNSNYYVDLVLGRAGANPVIPVFSPSFP